MLKKSLKLSLSLLAAATVLLGTASQAIADNVARGKKVTFDTPPNYLLLKEKNPAYLTDGIYTSAHREWDPAHQTSSLWLQQGTLGWEKKSPVIITIDLEKVQPISGVSFNTAGGRAGVTWPTAIYLAVSDDQKTWHSAGDLVELSCKNGTPPREGYGEFRYTTHDLNLRTRYVALAVMNLPYTFVDEIEIYAGNENAPSPAQMEKRSPSFDLKGLIVEEIGKSSILKHVRSHALQIGAYIDGSNIGSQQKEALRRKLSAIALDADLFNLILPDDKAIAPFNTIHKNVLSVYGELLSLENQGRELLVWKQHRFAWLPFLHRPSQAARPELRFSMLQNQFRSDALLLTNSSPVEKTVTFTLADLPPNLRLTVDAAEWTDTLQNVIVADALIPITPRNNRYHVTIPAGVTRKLWLTVDSSALAAGTYKSTLAIDDGESVPVTIQVAPLRAEKPRLSLGMWDYTDGSGKYGITRDNRDAAIQSMRSHFVDSPWASRDSLPQPVAADFDATGRLTRQLDFKLLDEWIARWPGAKRYFIYLYVSDSFAGEKIGTEAFHTKVGNWARAIAAHVPKTGIKAGQLVFHFLDEPQSERQDLIVAAWARAFKAAAPELGFYTNPVWLRPDQKPNQESITPADIICPVLPKYYRGGQPVKTYYENLQRQGKELWLYQCIGPVRLFDPQLYYRYQAWHTFSIGGTGQIFWSFGDTTRASSSWNEYASSRESFAPAFLSKNTVHNSVHWDAVREGMQDHEELAMLQDAITQSTNDVLKREARAVLDNAVKTITGVWKDPLLDDARTHYYWHNGEVDPEIADAQLIKVKTMLVKLKTMP